MTWEMNSWTQMQIIQNSYNWAAPNHPRWWWQRLTLADLVRCCWRPQRPPRRSSTARRQSGCILCWRCLQSQNAARAAAVAADTWWCMTRPGHHCHTPSADRPTSSRHELPPGWQVFSAMLLTHGMNKIPPTFQTLSITGSDDAVLESNPQTWVWVHHFTYTLTSDSDQDLDSLLPKTKTLTYS